MARVSARTLHGLAEDIYEELDRRGYWDEKTADQPVGELPVGGVG